MKLLQITNLYKAFNYHFSFISFLQYLLSNKQQQRKLENFVKQKKIDKKMTFQKSPKNYMLICSTQVAYLTNFFFQTIKKICGKMSTSNISSFLQFKKRKRNCLSELYSILFWASLISNSKSYKKFRCGWKYLYFLQSNLTQKWNLL